MKKNMVKATVYVVEGIMLSLFSIRGIFFLYFSNTFLPVYVGKTYVIGNQILRYVLYITLAAVVVLSVKLADYGRKYLIKKIFCTKRR